MLFNFRYAMMHNIGYSFNDERRLILSFAKMEKREDAALVGQLQRGKD